MFNQVSRLHNCVICGFLSGRNLEAIVRHFDIFSPRFDEKEKIFLKNINFLSICFDSVVLQTDSDM